MKLSEKWRKTLGWKGLKSIEFLPLRLLWRSPSILLLLLYVTAVTPTAWQWVKIKRVRMDDAGRIESLLKEGLDSHDLSSLEAWLTYRPLSESAEIIRRVETYSGHFSPLLFLDFARRADSMKDTEKKHFWIMYTRFRLRYDALRCGLPNAVDLSESFIDMTQTLSPQIFEEIPQEKSVKFARQALDFDAKYPAENNPRDICQAYNKLSKISYPPALKEIWSTIRFTLRFETDNSLKKAEEALKKAAAEKKKAP